MVRGGVSGLLDIPLYRGFSGKTYGSIDRDRFFGKDRNLDGVLIIRRHIGCIIWIKAAQAVEGHGREASIQNPNAGT